MLNLKNVLKTFPQPGGGRLTVLDIPELQVAAGEQVVLVGRSGGGKTTLLHTIAGITLPDAGSVVVDGIDIAALSESGRDRFRAARIGYVFQTFNLLAGFTALENVRLGMTFGHGRHDSQRARMLLERVGLGDRLDYRPSQLSVGQQQRVAIARAMAGRPKLLLADEPTANVDPASQQAVIDLIRGTCTEEGITLLMVTHSSEVSEQFERVESLESLNRIFQTT
ncbi:ABC transporter ATP-binding protein [Candidatus Laterigemmans baculatus]|uniref:ABC transporter ATP-binding protein n=1 Tax=Candidatus Laterigemmans baculatus TaxID=2770505 RepID=UPI0013DC9C1A|nr:ABC transporter ATP-binding protein [Candidatus Laterigemmans baculatus]